MTTSEPVRWNRTIYRGTDHEWTVRRVDATGTAVIPTEARAQVRPYYGGPVWIETGIDIDSTDGWVQITIPESMTEPDEWGTYSVGVWDLECVVGGKVSRWVMGDIEVSQDVTREEP